MGGVKEDKLVKETERGAADTEENLKIYWGKVIIPGQENSLILFKHKKHLIFLIFKKNNHGK